MEIRTSCPLALAKIGPVCLYFRQPVAHRSLDYGGLGWVINTVIATQAQGLAHSEVITCKLLSLSVTQDRTLPCGNTELLRLKWHETLRQKVTLQCYWNLHVLLFDPQSSQIRPVVRCAYRDRYILCFRVSGLWRAGSICRPLAALPSQGRRVRGI